MPPTGHIRSAPRLDVPARTTASDRVLFPGPFAWQALLAVLLVSPACGPTAESPTSALASGEWMGFEGSWNAAGSRRALHLGADRRASILDLRGTMLLHGEGRPGTGFRSEVVALSDSATGLVGRGVWTDERGDQVFSEIVGEGTASRNRITGTIVGGTGRYAGATGSYEFSWHYVLESEDGSIQGRAVELHGRVRRGTAAEGTGR